MKKFLIGAIVAALVAVFCIVPSHKADATTYYWWTLPASSCQLDDNAGGPAPVMQSSGAYNTSSTSGTCLLCPLPANASGTTGVSAYVHSNGGNSTTATNPVSAQVISITGSGSTNSGTLNQLSYTQGAGNFTMTVDTSTYNYQYFNLLRVCMDQTISGNSNALYGYAIGLAAQ